MTKVCKYCSVEQEIENFAWKSKKNGQRSAKCKSCQKDYDAQNYLLNKDKKQADSKVRSAEYRKQSRKLIVDYLRTHPCVDCGNSDIRVLQFDHKESVGGKGRRVGNFLSSPTAVVREIDKCDVRCANCHMIRTQQQFGWERI